MGITREIKRKWFNSHVAEYKKINDRISVLDWGNPDSFVFRIRYVFDGRYLYISGDLGEAVFTLTWNGNPKSFLDINLHYFHEKLTAYKDDDKYEFDRNEARKNLQEEIDYLSKGFDYDDVDDEHFKILEEMKNLTSSCSSNKEWEYKIAYETNLFDDLQKYDSDCFEWIFRAGEVIPKRIKAYLIGLKMAAKKLEN